MGREQLLLPVGLALHVSERVLRRLQIGNALMIGGAQPVDLKPGARELRLGMLERNPERGIIEAEENLALGNPLVVLDLNRDDRVVDIGAGRKLVGLHIGVVGRGRAPGGKLKISGDADKNQGHAHHQREAQPATVEARAGIAESAHSAAPASGAVSSPPRSERLRRTRINSSITWSRSASVKPAKASPRTSAPIAIISAKTGFALSVM